jgi:gluconolactonase
VTRLEPDGTVTPLAESFEGAAFNGPAGVAVRSDGSVYFTDPGIDRSPQQEFRGVFRIAPDGTVTAEHRGAPSEAPFSLALSPDERQLYLSDANYNIVRVFDVAADGTLSEAREFVTPGGKPFGLAVDDRGNVYVSVSREQLVEVFAPDGSRWGAIPVPGQGLPMFFGTVEFGGPDGRTLYITAPGGIYQVTLAQP